jgi:ribosome recycling factor
MDADAQIKKAREDMKKAVDHTLHEFSTLHTGKASPAMIETVSADAYGSSMKVKELAAIMTPDPRTIVIQPWDKSVLKAIEKGIQSANIGFNPVIDGAIIRISIPELSRERRQDLVKVAGGMAEEGKVRIRGIRQAALGTLRALQKDSKISEDDLKLYEKDVQKMTDSSTEEIAEHLKSKEKELLAI